MRTSTIFHLENVCLSSTPIRSIEEQRRRKLCNNAYLFDKALRRRTTFAGLIFYFAQILYERETQKNKKTQNRQTSSDASILRNNNHQKSSGAEEDRTPDLYIANVALSQLSYRPITVFTSCTRHSRRLEPHHSLERLVPPTYQPDYYPPNRETLAHFALNCTNASK